MCAWKYQVVEHLNKHYDPKPLVIAERFKFHKRNQQADESIAEYCARLRKHASTCQFGTCLDEALRDRLVCACIRCSLRISTQEFWYL